MEQNATAPEGTAPDGAAVESPPPAGPAPTGGKWLRPLIILGVVLSIAVVAGGIILSMTLGSSKTSTPSKDAQAAALVDCMRKNGVPNFPSAQPGGVVHLTPQDGIDPASDAYKKADKACAAYKPSGAQQQGGPQQGGGPLNGQQPVGPGAGVKPGTSGGPQGGPGGPIDTKDYVACMRTHGMPNFPDADPQGMFNGVDTGSDQFKSAHEACKKNLPAGGPAPQ
jgi:hypothetical protein